MKSFASLHSLVIGHTLLFAMPYFFQVILSHEEEMSIFREMLPVVILLMLIGYSLFLLSHYTYHLGKIVDLKRKGYVIQIFPLTHLLIQFHPKKSVTWSWIADYKYQVDFMPYDTLNKVTNEEELANFLQDYLVSEKTGLCSQLAFSLLLIMTQIYFGLYWFLPHALTMPIFFTCFIKMMVNFFTEH